MTAAARWRSACLHYAMEHEGRHVKHEIDGIATAVTRCRTRRVMAGDLIYQLWIWFPNGASQLWSFYRGEVFAHTRSRAR